MSPEFLHEVEARCRRDLFQPEDMPKGHGTEVRARELQTGVELRLVGQGPLHREGMEPVRSSDEADQGHGAVLHSGLATVHAILAVAGFEQGETRPEDSRPRDEAREMAHAILHRHLSDADQSGQTLCPQTLSRINGMEHARGAAVQPRVRHRQRQDEHVQFRDVGES